MDLLPLTHRAPRRRPPIRYRLGKDAPVGHVAQALERAPALLIQPWGHVAQREKPGSEQTTRQPLHPKDVVRWDLLAFQLTPQLIYRRRHCIAGRTGRGHGIAQKTEVALLNPWACHDQTNILRSPRTAVEGLVAERTHCNQVLELPALVITVSRMHLQIAASP